MNLPHQNTSKKVLFLASMLEAIFITYPNIVNLPCDIQIYTKWYHISYLYFFAFRFIYFSLLIWILSIYNLRKNQSPAFGKRFLDSFLISLLAYVVYVGISILTKYKTDWYGSMLPFQFFVMCILSSIMGYTLVLKNEQQKKELEISQLKNENLQSRYMALTNQINPHFFFNSLNGLTSLIRKKNEENAIEYVNKLSDIFRYVLQSDKKSLVNLEEELNCVHALFYMMEVRFANKLVFNIRVANEHKTLKLPVLSLLPIIDNIVVHNIIDSEHKMQVEIFLSETMELCISNPIYPKLIPPNTNGTGLKNLENRFLLLMNKSIRIINDGKIYIVVLPLLKD